MELSSIYNTAPVGLAVIDRDLRFLRINERLAAMNGRSVAEHLGRTVREVLPEIAPQAEQVLRRILETGEALRDVEVKGKTPADPHTERVWLEQFTPLRDEAGEVVAISVVAEEVTERRRLEQEVREGQSRLHQALDRLDVALEAGRMGVWEWLPGSDEAWWSRQIFEFVELPPTPDGKARSTDFLDLVDEDDDLRAVHAGPAHAGSLGGRSRPRAGAGAAAGGAAWRPCRVHERGAGQGIDVHRLPAPAGPARGAAGHGLASRGREGRAHVLPGR